MKIIAKPRRACSENSCVSRFTVSVKVIFYCRDFSNYRSLCDSIERSGFTAPLKGK